MEVQLPTPWHTNSRQPTLCLPLPPAHNLQASGVASLSIANTGFNVTSLTVSVLSPAVACAVSTGACDFAAGPIDVAAGGTLLCPYTCDMPAGFSDAPASVDASFVYSSASGAGLTVAQSAAVGAWPGVPVNEPVFVIDQYLATQGLFTTQQLLPADVTRSAVFEATEPVPCGCVARTLSNTAVLATGATPTAANTLASATASITVPACAGGVTPPEVFTTPSDGLGCKCNLDWCGVLPLAAGSFMLAGPHPLLACAQLRLALPPTSSSSRCPPPLAPHARRRITKTAYPETVDFTKPQPCGGAAVEAAAKASTPAAASPSRDFQAKCSRKPASGAAPRAPSFYDWLVEYTLAVTAQPSDCACSVPNAKVTFTAADNCDSATVITLGALGRAGCAYVGCAAGQTFTLAKGQVQECGVACGFTGQVPPASVTVGFEWSVGAAAPAKLQREVDFDWGAGDNTFAPSRCITLTDTFSGAPAPVNTPTQLCYPDGALGAWAAPPITYNYVMSQAAICPLQDANGMIQVRPGCLGMRARRALAACGACALCAAAVRDVHSRAARLGPTHARAKTATGKKPKVPKQPPTTVVPDLGLCYINNATLLPVGAPLDSARTDGATVSLLGCCRTGETPDGKGGCTKPTAGGGGGSARRCATGSGAGWYHCWCTLPCSASVCAIPCAIPKDPLLTPPTSSPARSLQ